MQKILWKSWSMGLGALLLAASGASANDGAHRCAEVVAAELKALGIAQSEIQSEAYRNRFRTSRSGQRVLGVDAWIGLERCESGELVVKMNPQCRVEEVYTVRGCDVPGANSY